MKRAPTCALMLSLAALLNPARSSAAAVFSELNGDVRARPAGADDFLPAVLGRKLANGTQLRVGADSRAVLGFEDGSRVELGAGSQFTLEQAAEKGRAVRLTLGYLIAWVNKPSSGFSVRTPEAVVAVRGTHFSVADRGHRTRVRVFSGLVSVKDNRGRETMLKEGQSLEAERTGLSPARTAAAAFPIQGSDWLMDPPDGYERDAEGGWTRVSREKVSFQGRPVVVEHTEKISVTNAAASWEQSRPWPDDCRNQDASLPQVGAISRSTLQGKPTFSFACVLPASRPMNSASGNGKKFSYFGYGERLRVSDTAADFDGRAAAHVVRAKYTHHVALPGLPTPAADLLYFVGANDGGDRDGPGIDAYLDALQTLRPGVSEPASPSAPSSSQEDKGVPLLR